MFTNNKKPLMLFLFLFLNTSFSEASNSELFLPSTILLLLEDSNPSNFNPVTLNPSITSFDEGTFRFALQGTPENNNGIRRDFVAQGQEYFYTPNNSNLSITVSEDKRELRMSIMGYGLVDNSELQTDSDSWTLNLEVESGVLRPGVYNNATRTLLNSGNGLSFSGNARSCNRSNGQFRIIDIEFSGNEVTRFVADFMQTCEGGLNSPLNGSIYFDSSNPPAVFEEPPLVATSPSPSVAAPLFPGASVVIDSVNIIAIGRSELFRFDEANSSTIARTRLGGRDVNLTVRTNENRSYSIRFVSGSFDIDPDRDQPLSTGLYTNAFGSPAAEFDISGFGASCSSPSSSQFRIFSIRFNAEGDLERLLADFALTCSNSTPTDGQVRGSIDFDNTIDFF